MRKIFAVPALLLTAVAALSGCAATGAEPGGVQAQPAITGGYDATDPPAAMALSAAGGEVQPDIIGGHEATGDTSWMVSMRYDAPAHDRYDWPSCGATLVFRGWAVTAAHCVTDMPSGISEEQKATLAARYHLSAGSAAIPVKDKQFKVRVGSKDRTQGGEVVRVVSILAHPGFTWAAGAPQAEVDDIALLKLEHLVDQQTIPLGSKPAKPGNAITLYGWGDTEPDSASPSLPTKLQQLETMVVSPGKCADALISAREICTGNPNGTDGPCYGDSGGPAVQVVDGVARFVGITSRGASEYCGVVPGVYTSSPEFRAWVYDTTRAAPTNPAATVSASEVGGA